MPMYAYNEATKKMTQIKELEKKVRKLEAEKNNITEISEVIVANSVVPSETVEKPGKLLFFDKFVRYIKQHFVPNMASKIASIL